MSASARHAVLDEIVSSFLEAHPDKRPSTTTILELIEWHHGQAEAASVVGAQVATCARCRQFLSATRVEMRIPVCSGCEGRPRRR